MRQPISWNALFIEMALLVSKRSKDPRTQCGCVLVSPDNTEITTGYNGFSRGIKDTQERWMPEKKYPLVNHSELNAILNAHKDLRGWRAYITMVPCPSCCNALIQAGIVSIIYLNEPSSTAFDYALSFELLKEAGVSIEKFKE